MMVMPEVGAARFRTVDELRAILNQAPIGICIVGPDFVVIESNPTLDDMLGLSAERFHGMHESEFTHPDDAASARDTYQSLAAGGKRRAELEGRYRRGDGTWFWGLLTLGVVRTSSGTVDYYMAMVEDSRPVSGPRRCSGATL